ncbi:MAG: DUF378 domain-containing protein [Candidatus Aenigmatarchaeota archaeon]
MNDTIDLLAMILVIIGGLNWLLVGAADMNLVTTVFGVGSMITKAVYIIVGLAALYMIYYLFKKE